MGNVNNSSTDIHQQWREEEDVTKTLDQMRREILSARVKLYVEMMTREELIRCAVRKCTNQTVARWLRGNAGSFSKLWEMFDFLKKHIDEEEKKNHSNDIDIIFVAHGSITDSMIPASCLLPLPTITDVVLYSPWNCVIDAKAAYGVAAGLIKPQHRVFYCKTKSSCQTPNEKHQPLKLPDHWNSLKTAGDQMIPNIELSPLKQPEDGYWKSFENLTRKHGPPGRNRVVIPFIVPGDRSQTVPFSVVTLALSLVLLSSRFTATVHLCACLGDRSGAQRCDREHLRQQYTCAMDDTGMTVSDSMFTASMKENLKSG